ncbi:MAG: hypothetical protein R2751_18215 [Bacteroidales bacterium]
MPATKILGIGLTIGGLLMTQLKSLKRKRDAGKRGFKHPPYG